MADRNPRSDLLLVRNTATLKAGRARERLEALAAQTGMTASTIHGKALLRGLTAIESDPASLIRPEQAPAPAPAPATTSATTAPKSEQELHEEATVAVLRLLPDDEHSQFMSMCIAMGMGTGEAAAQILTEIASAWAKRTGNMPKDIESAEGYRAAARGLLQLSSFNLKMGANYYEPDIALREYWHHADKSIRAAGEGQAADIDRWTEGMIVVNRAIREGRPEVYGCDGGMEGWKLAAERDAQHSTHWSVKDAAEILRDRVPLLRSPGPMRKVLGIVGDPTNCMRNYGHPYHSVDLACGHRTGVTAMFGNLPAEVTCSDCGKAEADEPAEAPSKPRAKRSKTTRKATRSKS